MNAQLKTSPADVLVAIYERVATDHHWIVRPGHAPEHADVPLPLEKHGKPYARGACPIRRGESTTRLALFDLDDHDKNLPWSTMAGAAERICDELERRGLRPAPFRSGGGYGIHLFLLWDEPQDAYSVRLELRDVLAACDFRDGTAGIAAGEVEIFPKQDSVAPDKSGSMFVLPLARKSVPLEPLVDFEPCTSIEWRISDPVTVHERAPRALAAAQPLGVDAEEAHARIKDLDPDMPYDEWVKVGMALHHESGGDEWGLDVWDMWSARGSKYKSRDDLETHYRSFRGDGEALVTLASLGGRVSDVDEFDDLTKDDPVDEVAAPKKSKPLFKIVNSRVLHLAEKAEELLQAEVYARNHKLVRIGGARELSGNQLDVRRDDEQPAILPVGVEFVLSTLDRLARFETYRKRENEWVPVDCPRSLALNIVERGHWSTLHPLQTIASAPFIRPDLSVCDVPGYDEGSATFYTPNASFPPIAAAPSRDDAMHALATLLEPFAEFPFATSESRSAFVSHVLTEAVRVAIDNAPIFVYTAPAAGTGKTLLSGMPARIVHGREPAMRAWPGGEGEGAELRKVLFASLLVGDRTIGFDNVPRGVKVRAPELARFVTAPRYGDRVLGQSDVRALPNNSVVFLTGNNITPVGDLARRSLVIRLDADTENLRARRFRITDLKAHVAARRAELLAAALTIVRAFVAAGCPTQASALPSFEAWSRIACDPLLWLGMSDPVATQDAETEDESHAIGPAFELLAAALPGSFTAEQVVDACMQLQDTAERALWTALREAGCTDPEDTTKVRYWLRDNRGAIASGLKLDWALPGTRGVRARAWALYRQGVADLL